MTVINTNTASMIARDAIQRNDRAMGTAMERLSLRALESIQQKTTLRVWRSLTE